jgi:hypothetical protein
MLSTVLCASVMKIRNIKVMSLSENVLPHRSNVVRSTWFCLINSPALVNAGLFLLFAVSAGNRVDEL